MEENNFYYKSKKNNIFINILPIFLLVLIIIFGLMAFDIIPNPFNKDSDIISITLNVNDIKMHKGEKYRLEVKSHKIDNLNFTSSDSNIAKVDNYGYITAINYGTANIIASLKDNNSVKGTCTVTVVKPVSGVEVEGITLNKNNLNIYVGDSAILTYKITPSNASTGEIKWSSSDNKVATIDRNGKVVGISKGTAIITVETSNGKKATCYVNVSKKDSSNPPTTQETKYTLTYDANGGSVNPTSKQLNKGSEYGNLPTPTRSGYKFDGWYTKKDGGSKVSSSTKINSNTTIYAHWTQNSQGTSTASSLCEKVKNNSSIDYASFKELSKQNNNNDYYAIKAAHDCANKYNKPVVVTKDTYHIYKNKEKTITVSTNTNLNDSTIYIHNENLSKAIDGHIYEIDLKSELRKACKSLSDTNCTYEGELSNFSGDFKSLAPSSGKYFVKVLERDGKKVYHRNKGDGKLVQEQEKKDVYRVYNGNVQDPMYWKYQSSKIKCTRYPIPSDQLVFQNAKFKTVIKNTCKDCGFMASGIKIKRSNSLIQNIRHNFVNTSYKAIHEMHNKFTGFINVGSAADVEIKNCVVSSMYYNGISKETNKPSNKKGSTYDLTISDSANIKLNGVKMYDDGKYNELKESNDWGVTATNGSKNITVINSSLNRIDAHKGILVLTVKNSVLGKYGITVTGTGDYKNNKIVVEDTTWKYGSYLIKLRNDYGITWNGSIEIKNCKVSNATDSTFNMLWLTGLSSNEKLAKGFGQPIYNPVSIKVNNLTINSSNVKRLNVFSIKEKEFKHYYFEVFKRKSNKNEKTSITLKNIKGVSKISNYNN